MNVYPFQPRVARHASPIDATFEDDFPFDHHPEFDCFEPDDEVMNLFGSIDRQYRYAHRTISATILATLTGVDIATCQALHSALFELLEAVGDFDGVIVAPTLFIAGRNDRLARTAGWLQGNPPPDVDALWEAAEFEDVSTELLGRRIDATIERHSLDLAMAADTNPSLTFGSFAALEGHLGEKVLERMDPYRVDHVERLIRMALDLLLCLPDGIRLEGGATIHPIGPVERLLPPLSV